MKRFDYWCEPCKHKFEEFITSDAIIRCEKCNGDAKRLISAPTIHMTTISDSKLREEFKEDYY